MKRQILLNYLLSAMVFLIITLWGMQIKEENYIPFSTLTQYMLMPFLTFMCSMVLGSKTMRTCFIYTIIYGAWALGIQKIVYDDITISSILYSFLPSIFGICIGIVLKVKKERREGKQ